ncbi:MAG TPA: hypothetical protein VIX37_11865 [Candidatus Sulfotelmatobacter sp.]
MERRLYEAVKYMFSPDEIRELGEALAREAQTVFDLREQKKTVSAELVASIKSVEHRVGELTDKINFGFEMREVECMVMLETPRPGMKRIIRIDNNEMIRDEPMTSAEMQGSFGFNDGEDRRPEG